MAHVAVRVHGVVLEAPIPLVGVRVGFLSEEIDEKPSQGHYISLQKLKRLSLFKLGGDFSGERIVF